jgi:hypothetical protein
MESFKYDLNKLAYSPGWAGGGIISLSPYSRSQGNFNALESARDKCRHVLREETQMTHSSSFLKLISAFRKEASFIHTTHHTVPDLMEPFRSWWLQATLPCREKWMSPALGRETQGRNGLLLRLPSLWLPGTSWSAEILSPLTRAKNSHHLPSSCMHLFQYLQKRNVQNPASVGL